MNVSMCICTFVCIYVRYVCIYVRYVRIMYYVCMYVCMSECATHNHTCRTRKTFLKKYQGDPT